MKNLNTIYIILYIIVKQCFVILILRTKLLNICLRMMMMMICYYLYLFILHNVANGCNIFRNYTVNGPMSLGSLPFAKDFSKYNMSLKNFNEFMNGVGQCSVNQIPNIAKKYQKYDGCYESSWSVELVDILVEAAKNKIDFSPIDYPYCVLDYYSALAKYPVTGKRVLVAGSISPWNEGKYSSIKP